MDNIFFIRVSNVIYYDYSKKSTFFFVFIKMLHTFAFDDSNKQQKNVTYETDINPNHCFGCRRSQ